MLPHSPPAPTAADYSALPHFVDVTFDRELRTATLDPGNWLARWTNKRYAAVTAAAAGQVVRFTLNAGVDWPGLNIVNFTPPPFDVLSKRRIPAAAFSDFPLT